MEKDYRLFVKNLPVNIDDNGLKKIFDNLVTIKKIDLKEKKDLNNKVNKFAFVNITTTDRGLHECFGKLNAERFNGFEISVELAKESFLDRLKREREESDKKKESPKDYTKSLAFENLTSKKSKHKKFDDVDFSSKEFEIEKVKEKRKSSVDVDDLKADPVQSFEDVSTFKIKDFKEPYNSLKVGKKKYVNNLDADDTEISNICRNNKKAKKANEFNNNKPLRHSIPEIPVSESEKKRLMSLKEKKKVFKAQEKAIRNALNSVDDTKLNKKIVFDDDIDIESPNQITQKSSKQKQALFESDNEEEGEFGWDEEEIEAKADTKRKLLKMQTSIGNDKRFTLDERFVDDDEENVKESNNSEQNDDATFDEKKWQLGLLEQVLGKPVTAPTATSNDTIQKKKKMIRYDPTANDHEKYEVTVEKPKEKQKKKKKRNVTEEVQEEEAPIPTSKDIYYDVSEKLADSFKPVEGFSLLKNLGRDTVTDKRETEPVKEAENNQEGFQFSFTSKNPFKYDSTDDENGDEKGGDDYSFKFNANANKTSEDDDRLFTPLGDSRIEELNKFFNTPATVDEEAFKRRRRELKKIVRTKIRNNVKKATPWNKKKVWKEKKKQR